MILNKKIYCPKCGGKRPEKTTKKTKIGDCFLYCGDTFEILPKLKIESHAVISDPPFGITNCDWDKVPPLDCFWEMVKSKTTPMANFVFFACGMFYVDLITSNRRWFRSNLIWQKNNKVGFPNANRQPMRNHEEILIFGQPGFKKKATYNPQKIPGGRPGVRKSKKRSGVYHTIDGIEKYHDGMMHPGSVLVFNTDKGKQHPTQKPLALMEWLIKSYTNEGDLVIDPFMGSGTTGVACAKLGRQFIGIEKVPKYYEMAVERIKEIRKEMRR